MWRFADAAQVRGKGPTDVELVNATGPAKWQAAAKAASAKVLCNLRDLNRPFLPQLQTGVVHLLVCICLTLLHLSIVLVICCCPDDTIQGNCLDVLT